MTRRPRPLRPATDRDEIGAVLTARLGRLRRLRHVPDGVLAEIVAADGLSIRQPDPAEATDPAPPAVDADTPNPAARTGSPDRALAAQLCEGCPVQDECLELDLRWMADQSVGVFAGLTETDRRALYPLWREHGHGDDRGCGTAGGAR